MWYIIIICYSTHDFLFFFVKDCDFFTREAADNVVYELLCQGNVFFSGSSKQILL